MPAWLFEFVFSPFTKHADNEQRVGLAKVRRQIYKIKWSIFRAG